MKTRDLFNIFKTTRIMKTGGTMNFLKRAGAILMVVAIFASSCNKYADDFEQINTKLDALALTVQGVTTLNADITALKGQVTALQTAIAGIPTATAQTAQFAAVKVETDKIMAQITAITTTLGTVATAGTATKAVVDQLKIDLAAVTTKITTDNAAMTTKLTALGTTDVAQSAQLTALVAANADLLTKINTIQASLTAAAQTGTDADVATQLTIGGLQAMLDAQKLILDQILANTTMYNGDVNLTSDAEVAFYLPKSGQLGIVNGNVKINFAGISAAKLADARMITSKINAVIGSTGIVANSVTVNFKQGDNVDLSTLSTVAGAMTLTGTDKGAGADVNLAMLSSVGGTLTMDYDGPYASATLSKVGGDLLLVNKAVAAATTPLGTTSINLPAVAVTGKVDDVVIVGATGVVVYPLATDITLAGGVSSLTAAKATSIKLGSATYATGLGVSSSTTAAATIDLSAATGITGAATVTGFGATAVNLSKLVTATGGLMVTTGSTGTVDLTAYNEPAGLVVTGPKTLVLPAMVAGPIVSTTAETVTLAKHDFVILPTIAAVKTLTAAAINTSITLSTALYPALITAEIWGKTTTTWGATVADVTVTSGTIKTLTLGGDLNWATVSTNPVLTSLTTKGRVNSFSLISNATLAAVTLGHAHYEGGPGSSVTVTGNTVLAALKTSTDEMNTLSVNGNPALASMDFSSYQVIPNPGATVLINIGYAAPNKLTGTYTAPVVGTATTPLIEAKLVSVDLLTLKSYVAQMKAVLLPAPIALTVWANVDDVKPATGSQSLITEMVGPYINIFGTSVVDATGGINTAAEFTIVQ